MSSQGDVQESTLLFHDGTKSQPLHIIIIGSVSLVIAIILLIIASVLYGCTGGKIPFDYGVVIDAGSTHTQVFLYQWLGNKDHGTGDVLQKNSCAVDGGIAILPDPTVIIPCVSNVSYSVPNLMKSETPLYLGATAGMRLLRLASPEQAKLVLLALRYALMQLKLNVMMVDIIKGYEEGTAAWITVNYLLKSLRFKLPSWMLNEDNDPWYSTYGALDMGGASTQIAFAVDPSLKDNHNHTTTLKLYGHKYHVVSESFLCFGMMQAFYRHQALLIKDLNSTENVLDPCLPKGNFSKSMAGQLLGGPCTQNPGFEDWLGINGHRSKEFIFEGTSDFEGCKQSVSNLLNTGSCVESGFQSCPRKFNVSDASNKFVAFSSYYYMTNFLNSTNASLEEFTKNAENWCQMTWDEIKHHKYKKSDLSHLTQYCFGALYIIGWLTDVYSFDESSWNNIIFQQKVHGSDIGWTLGYMINATNAIPEEAPTPPVISTVVFSCLALCSIAIAAIGIAFIHKYCKHKFHQYRYSQLKDKNLLE